MSSGMAQEKANDQVTICYKHSQQKFDSTLFQKQYK